MQYMNTLCGAQFSVTILFVFAKVVIVPFDFRCIYIL